MEKVMSIVVDVRRCPECPKLISGWKRPRPFKIVLVTQLFTARQAIKLVIILSAIKEPDNWDLNSQQRLSIIPLCVSLDDLIGGHEI